MFVEVKKTVENEDSMLQLYKMLEDILHAGSSQHCMLASVVVWYARKRTLRKARHSTGQYGTARHRTALRRAVERARLN